MATAIAENPSASLPESMRNWANTLAAYRFLDNEAVTHEQIMQPHWMSTRQEAMRHARVLLAADTTDVNLSSHEAAEGLGPIGRGSKARGFFVHTVLAMDADTQQLLGCMYQEPFVRQPAPKGETKAQRKKRVRESQVWERSIQAIGPVPKQQKWIYVGDRGSDIYTFWQMCEQLGYDFVVRVAQNRRVLVDEMPEAEDPEVLRLKTLARSLPAQGGRVLPVPAQRQHPARDALVQIRGPRGTYPTARSRGGALENGGQGLDRSCLGTGAAARRRSVGMDLGDDGTDLVRTERLGTGQMVHEVDPLAYAQSDPFAQKQRRLSVLAGETRENFG
jgi:hypothetical protein